ncbi:DEAD/DEAH box helicase [Paenibacillus sp. IHBB 10380]|uniref:DEAD/DEAH box helicase n=1 Tax=Paenibacillus sp. IHBB 10380 TaxID=1566358 RepID=UPI0005CFE20B|nr:DEAD/DEAH box helicase [Paenibacillus sp. IHBB 10380]AJS60930.1 helicase SNF [Paenibacillus sp. IHBB 10380]
MNIQLTTDVIRTWCGKTSYDKGETYYLAGKVLFTTFDQESDIYRAAVTGNSSEQVTVSAEPDGEVQAECTCPTLSSYPFYCQHIAAVLMGLYDIQEQGSSAMSLSSAKSYMEDDLPRIVDGGLELTNFVLELFTDKKLRSSRARPYFDSRTSLDVEFICRLVANGYNRYMFSIEMKLGPKRLYVVQKIRDFLEAIDRGESYVFSKHFTYDPEIHNFSQANDDVIRQLIHMYNSEQMYRESSNLDSNQRIKTNDRMLRITPIYWDKLLVLLGKATSVKLEHNRVIYDGIAVSEETMPLHFEFDQVQVGGYELDIQGLDNIVVMESYGMAVSEGKLMKLSSEQCKRLAELKYRLEISHKHRIQIPQEQLELFVDNVIPGLMKLGSVHIAKSVSDRMIHTPLKAKLYLDRVKNRLLAGLEFHYGDIMINPLEVESPTSSNERILVRNGDHETSILALMEHSSFYKTEGGYFLTDEDAEYEFLVYVVPQLEKLVEIYVTTAVKEKIHRGHTAPSIRVNADSRNDWLEFQFDIAGVAEAEVRNLLESLETKRKYYRLPNGALLPLEAEEFQEIIRFMNDMNIGTGEVIGNTLRLPLVHGLHLMDVHKEGNTVKLGKSLRRLLENMRNPDLLDFSVPESLAPVLRDYQQYGYQWMKMLAHYRFGGILADDMGLGKTIQSIAFIVSVLPEIRSQKMPALIVAPASLTYNWRNELKKFAPEVRTHIVDGSQEERSRVLQDTSEVDIIITSYPLLRRDINAYAKLSFHTLILDEAQMFKNYTTQTAQTVRKIQARHRFALTGTPIENSIEELWSIFNVVFPALFSTKKEFAALTRDSVAKRIRPFLLRRLKSDVLKELPERIESLLVSELLPDQKKLYMAYLAKLKHETLKHLNDKSFHKNKVKILAGLTRLRQLCCHPALFVEGYTGSSAKFEQLLETIDECRRAGKRMLIFSQFTGMLGLIGRELGEQRVPYFYLDGNTPASERVELCNRFNEGERELFLISLKAGGTGLNLTGADTVILYDLWWNPAVEAQAEARAHRIGQNKVVQVIRLVAQGTMEEKMYELQQNKKNLIEEVIRSGEETSSVLSEQEIREILMID